MDQQTRKHTFVQDEKYRIDVRKNPAPTEGDICVEEIGYGQAPANAKRFFRRKLHILHFVLSGSGRFCGEPVYAGRGFFSAPGQQAVHETGDQPYRSAWIMLRGDGAGALLRAHGIPPYNHVFDCPDATALTARLRLCVEEGCEGRDPNSYFLSLLYELLSVFPTVESPKAVHSAAVSRSLAYIRRHYAEPLTVQALASTVSLSAKHLCRLFVRETGMSPQAALIAYRMEQAQLLLTESELTVLQVAQAVGFADQRHFSQIFRKKVGAVPTEYRKEQRYGTQDGDLQL